MRSLNINTEIRGYRILERIGVGGMGEVYKAFHPGLNRMAAIKFLFQKDQADRFRNEAYIQSSVNHPNIAKLYEYLVEGDTPCIIMEYVEGTTLDSYIYGHGRMSGTETERILVQIVSALKYLHGKNILHRDIKPQNFKVEKDGTVKMLDFGISKSDYTPKLTQMGFVVGTTQYMAPEQFEYKAEKKSDIWSLGVMTYEMVTASLPFESNNPITLRTQISKARFTDPKILVPQISEKLSELITKSLRVNPSNRPSAAELEELLTGSPARRKSEIREAPPSGEKPSLLVGKISRKRAWVYGSVFVAAAALLIFALSSRLGSRKASTNKQDTLVSIEVPASTIVSSESATLTKVKIAVNNTENAFIVLPDGTSKPVPAELTGRPGESYDVRLHADGYTDKLVPVTFLQTSKIYTYSLEKKTEE